MNMRDAVKYFLISLYLSQILLHQPVLAQSASTTDGFSDNAVHCSGKMIDTLNDSRKEIDAADNAGDSARVIQLTQKNIEIASLCLDDLPSNAPSVKRVIIRNQILASLYYELDAYAHSSADPAISMKLLSNETRIAIDQCNESDLVNPQDPYTGYFTYARQRIGLVLDRDVKILAYSGTPIDEYQSYLRKCSIRLGRNDNF